MASTSNHFIRQLPSHKIIGKNFIDLKKRGYYFSGIDSVFVYMANLSKNDELLMVKVMAKEVQTSNLKGPEGLVLYSDSYISFDQNNIFLFEGIKSEVWSGAKATLKLSKLVKTPNFAKGIPLSSTTFLFRCIDNYRQNVLVKLQTSGKIKTVTGLLKKQIDGLFCTDGQLIKVPNSNKVFYTYYYRNQFVCADTNLNLIYRGKTIDTNSYAKIKIAKISSKNQLTLAAPPVYVNKHSCANDKYLFIHSGLKSDNETDRMHNDAAAIDVYNVSDGKYRWSFYLPDFDGKKLTDFRVYGQSLYAIYDHYLYKYQLNF